MVYKFDPKWFNGAIFEFADPLTMARGWMEFGSRLEPVPASYFPKQLVIERAKAPLPDLFHTSRGIFVVSERARIVFEKLAPGEVEFIPVDIKTAPTSWLNPLINAHYSMKDVWRPVAAQFVRGQVDFVSVCDEPKPRITPRINLASAYYFINVLGRAQRLLWLQMPTLQYGPRDDGTEIHALVHDFGLWKLTERAAGEPLIWLDTKWRHENREYGAVTHVLVEDALWRELDAHFPGQLHPLRAGGD